MLRRYHLDSSRLRDEPSSSLESDYPAKDILEHLASSEKTAWRIVAQFAKYLGSPVLEVGGGVGQISNELMNAGFRYPYLNPIRHCLRIW